MSLTPATAIWQSPADPDEMRPPHGTALLVKVPTPSGPAAFPLRDAPVARFCRRTSPRRNLGFWHTRGGGSPRTHEMRKSTLRATTNQSLTRSLLPVTVQVGLAAGRRGGKIPLLAPVYLPPALGGGVHPPDVDDFTEANCRWRDLPPSQTGYSGFWRVFIETTGARTAKNSARCASDTNKIR